MLKKAFPIVMFILLLTFCSKQEQNAKNKNLTAKGIRVTRQEIDEKIFSIGTISHIKKATITSKVSGKVEKIYVDIGSFVKKGTILIQLDKFPLELERKKKLAEVESAKSSLRLAEAKYKEAATRIEQHFSIIEKAQADLKNKKLSYENMQKVINRKKELFQMGAVAQEEYENLLTQLTNYKTQYELAQKELEIQSKGYQDSDIKQQGYEMPLSQEGKKKLLIKMNTTVEKAEVDVQKANLDNAKAELESINLLLSKTSIRSPITGLVAVKNIESGEQAVSDKPLLVIVNIDEVYAILNVPSSKSSKIHKGNKIEVTADAIPNKTFIGHIALISPIVDLQTRIVEIRGKIKNHSHLLRPGMFVRSYIYTGQKSQSILLPHSVLVTSESNKGSVFLVNKDKEVYITPVTFQDKENDLIEITQGLSVSNVVLKNGDLPLSDGDKIKEVVYEE